MSWSSQVLLGELSDIYRYFDKVCDGQEVIMGQFKLSIARTRPVFEETHLRLQESRQVPKVELIQIRVVSNRLMQPGQHFSEVKALHGLHRVRLGEVDAEAGHTAPSYGIEHGEVGVALVEAEELQRRRRREYFGGCKQRIKRQRIQESRDSNRANWVVIKYYFLQRESSSSLPADSQQELTYVGEEGMTWIGVT